MSTTHTAKNTFLIYFGTLFEIVEWEKLKYDFSQKGSDAIHSNVSLPMH